MPDRKRLPARVRGSRGTREGKRKAQEWALELLEADPLRTQASIAATIGYSAQALRWWMQREEGFRGRWNQIKRGGGSGPPDPGSLIDWRREYVNLEWQNPHNGRVTWTGETYGFQRPICEAWDDPKIRKLLVVVPVQHGKTTIIEQGSVHQFCKDPNSRIIGVARSQRHGDERAYAVQQMLIDDELYPELHEKWGSWISKPERREKPWGTRSFYIRGRKDAQRSPSMSWYGIQTDTYGARADLILLDDIDSPSLGPLERDKYVRTINGAISTRLAPGGKMVYIGTRCGIGDVIEQLKATGEWHVVEMQALSSDEEPLWPEMFTAEDLLKIRTARPVEFELMYQNNPSPEGTMIFTPTLVDNAKGQFSSAPSDWEFWTSLDPASSGRAAIVTVGHNPSTREMRVVDCEIRVNPRHDGLVSMVRTQLARHQPKWVVIEAQGGSNLFSDVPEVKDLIYDEGARLIPFQTTGQNKHDPAFGIPLLAREMERGRLRIANDEAAVEKMRPLINDLLGWQPQMTSKRRYDSVMALWFAVNSILANRRPGRKGTFVDPMVRKRPYLHNNHAVSPSFYQQHGNLAVKNG